MTNTAEQSVIERLESATTVDEIEALDRELAQIQAATQITTEQKAILSRLTLQAFAWLVGQQSRVIQRLQPPKNADGSLDGPVVLQWWVDRQRRDAIERETTDGSSESAKARIMSAKAIQEEMETARRQGLLVEREPVHAFLGKLSGVLRQAGDRLQRDFGREALEILNDAIESTSTLIDEGID